MHISPGKGSDLACIAAQCIVVWAGQGTGLDAWCIVVWAGQGTGLEAWCIVVWAGQGTGLDAWCIVVWAGQGTGLDAWCIVVWAGQGTGLDAWCIVVWAGQGMPGINLLQPPHQTCWSLGGRRASLQQKRFPYKFRPPTLTDNPHNMDL